jgi:hypothetical protein
LTHIKRAPTRKTIRIFFLPCLSPARLQKPVVIALRVLIVVTTAACIFAALA